MEGYIKKRNKYSHLSSEERGKIEAYLHQGVSISRIAYYLNRSKSTISEELRRGPSNGRYTAEISYKRVLRNRNKILRQFLKKGTNFDLSSEDEIRNIQDMINYRPMKALGWKSPAELILSFGLLL